MAKKLIKLPKPPKYTDKRVIMMFPTRQRKKLFNRLKQYKLLISKIKAKRKKKQAKEKEKKE